IGLSGFTGFPGSSGNPNDKSLLRESVDSDLGVTFRVTRGSFFGSFLVCDLVLESVLNWDFIQHSTNSRK
ncbi:MAG: hypothetical protein AB4426_17635, partial [Xenococcaceae cyanobacterium]